MSLTVKFVMQEPVKYSTNINSIDVNWGGFADPHAGILLYRFCLGTTVGLCDARIWEETGLQTGNYVNSAFDLSLLV